MNPFEELPLELIEMIEQYIGKSACLLNFVQKRHFLEPISLDELAIEAIKLDKPALLKFTKVEIDQNLVNLIFKKKAINCLKSINIPFTHQHFNTAIFHKDLDYLIYLHNHSCPWNVRTTENAAKGHLDCLVYL